MRFIEFANLKFISQIIFAFSFILLSVEFIQPGLITQIFSQDPFPPKADSNNNDEKKLILFWTQFFSEDFQPTLLHRIHLYEAIELLLLAPLAPVVVVAHGARDRVDDRRVLPTGELDQKTGDFGVE